MAKMLAYKRSTQQVQEVDTVNGTTVDLGNSILLADTLSTWPNRSENVVCVFQGDPYLLYRAAANEIRLSRYDGATWADVAGFTAVIPATGNIVPLCLMVEKDRLIAVVTVSGSVGVDGVRARRSAAGDGLTWDPVVSQNFATQPTTSLAGPSVVWRNVVWFATSEGIGYYDPTTDTVSAVFDSGSDTDIVGEKTTFGSFSFWGDDLYYLLMPDNPLASPKLYLLDTTWTQAAPVAPPAWTLQAVAVPAVGSVAISADSGNATMFVSKAGDLAAVYSGSLGTKFVTFQRVGSAIGVTDITTQLPVDLQTEINLGASFYTDDRRRTNEKHTIVIRFRPAIPVSIKLLDWDGVNEASLVATLDDGGGGLDLMVPEDERGEFRTFTDLQPAAYITAKSDVFPGRSRIDYVVRDSGSRPVDVFGEYSLDGQTWNQMTQGDGDSGASMLASSLAGIAYFFHWDAFNDLDGDYDIVHLRMIARISGV